MRRCSGLLAGIAAGLMLATAAPAGAASPDAVAALLAEQTRTSGFSGVVLVDRAGRAETFEAFGTADRAFDTPVARDTRFRIASITKLFTAVLIVQLAEEGRLSLDGSAADYLPGYAGDRAITIHSLLNHTSGLPNPDTAGLDEALADGLPLYQLPKTPDVLVARYAGGPPTHPVGTHFDYNNADYYVLGKVVEAVSGKPFEAVLRERILDPLGLTDTGMLRQQDVVARLAPAYFRTGDDQPLRNDLPVYPENWYAAGAMYSDADDLARFADALYGGRLVSPAGLERMLTPGLDDYGYGQWISDVTLNGAKKRVAVRFGQIMGANAVLYRVLEDDLTVVVLSNTNVVDMGTFARRIAAKALE